MSAGTWISPKASLSVLVFAAILIVVACRFLWNCREYEGIDLLDILFLAIIEVEDLGVAHVEVDEETEELHVENRRGEALGPNQLLAWPAATGRTDRSMTQ